MRSPTWMARALAIALLPAVLLSVTTDLRAQTTAITSRSQLTGTTINWQSIYPSGTPNQAVFSPTGIPGLGVRPSGSLTISVFAEGNGWNGGFAQGDPLLWGHFPSGGVLSLLFSTDVFGFGANLQSGVFGTFTGRIQAWDVLGNLLGSYSADAISGPTLGTAPFFGLRSVAGIRRITFDVANRTGTDQSLAINQATIEMTPVANVVPEPASTVLMATGLLALAVVARRRARAG